MHARGILRALLIAVLIWAVAIVVSTVKAGAQPKPDVLFWAQGLTIRTVEYERTGPLVPALMIYLQNGSINLGTDVKHRYYRVTNVLHAEKLSNGILREYRCLNENGDPQNVRCVVQYDTHRRVIFAQMVLTNAQFVTTYSNRPLPATYQKFDRSMGSLFEERTPCTP
jgi:hypothetical protein